MKIDGISWCGYGPDSARRCVCGLLLLPLTLLLFSPRLATAATYYVDAAIGDDSNPGSQAKPWRTLPHAGARQGFAQGDTCYVKNGDYSAFRESTDDRSKWMTLRSKWTCYKAYPGHSPCIDGILVKTRSKFTPFNHGSPKLYFEGFTICGANPLPVLRDYKSQASVYLNYTNDIHLKNCTIRCRSLSYDGPFAPYFKSHSAAVYGYEANDVTIEDCNIYNGARLVWDAKGDNWTIRNNTIHRFAGDAIRYVNAKGLLIEGNRIYDGNEYRACAWLVGSRTGDFQPDEIVVQAGTGARGIVSHWTIAERGRLEVWKITTKNFRAGYKVTGQTSGASLDVKRAHADHGDFIETHSDKVRDIVIRGNTLLGRWPQGITIYGQGQASDITIDNNFVSGPAKGLVLWGVNNVRLRNNTIVNGYVRLQTTTGGPSQSLIITEMYNNIFQQLMHEPDRDDEGYVRIIAHDNNIFGNNPNGQGRKYRFSLNTNEWIASIMPSLFVARNDYRLAAGSIAVDRAIPAYAPTKDILGNPRVGPPDIGCYERIVQKGETAPTSQTIADN